MTEQMRQEERNSRIRELTADTGWRNSDYARFADAPVADQERIIAANEARIAREAKVASAAPKPEPADDFVLCSCGHEVPRYEVMNASLGTSCSDCYDRMSG